MKITVSEGRRFAMRKSIVVAAMAPLVGLAVLYLAFLRPGGADTGYRLERLTRGSIENVVTCSGTLSAVGTVEIGTQVSGMIADVFVDFNDRVEQGTILAVLDTTFLKAAVMDAEAGLLSAQAQYEEAYAEYERNMPLFEKGYVSEQEFIPIRSALKIREATVRSALATLERAETNLGYAVIRAPIEGTVIQRNVEPGQTVAASLQTPTLFIIAEDLSEMEIHVDVDESDIGEVKEQQEARFTVQAYPDETFSGAVTQIRLQPEVLQNVVTYTVVVSAPNQNGLLLPGMTATVDIVVENGENVLLVPNSALRLTPTAEMIAEAGKRMQEPRGTLPDSTRQSTGAEMGGIGQRGGFPLPDISGSASAGTDLKVVWLPDEEGGVTFRPVRTGATDGKQTEIVFGPGLAEGMQVIVGFNGNQEAENDDAGSGRRQGGPPGFRIF